MDGSGGVSHEALFTAWPRLRDWIEEDRAGLVQHRRFTDSVRAWVDSGQHDDDLYRGVRLASLTAWPEAARDRVRLQPVEQEFLARSTAAEHAGQVAARRRTHRLRGLVAALSLLLVVAAAVVATLSQQSGRPERDRADSGRQQNLSRQLAAESALARTVDPRRAALAAFGSWRASPTVEGRSALLASTTDSYRGRMTGHVGAVNALLVSDDGKTAASGGREAPCGCGTCPRRRQLAVLDATARPVPHGSMTPTADRWPPPTRTPRRSSCGTCRRASRAFTVPGRGIERRSRPTGGTLVAYTDRGASVYETAGSPSGRCSRRRRRSGWRSCPIRRPDRVDQRQRRRRAPDSPTESGSRTRGPPR